MRPAKYNHTCSALTGSSHWIFIPWNSESHKPWCEWEWFTFLWGSKWGVRTINVQSYTDKTEKCVSCDISWGRRKNWALVCVVVVAKNDMMPAGPMGDPVSGVTVNRKKRKSLRAMLSFLLFRRRNEKNFSLLRTAWDVRLSRQCKFKSGLLS